MSNFRGEIGREEFTSSLFGNKDRVKIMAHVAQFTVEPPELFSGTDIVSETNISQSSIHQQLKILEKLKLVERLPRQGATVPYKRNESPIWEVFVRAEEAVDVLFPEK